jgi:hypothetical protein
MKGIGSGEGALAAINHKDRLKIPWLALLVLD